MSESYYSLVLNMRIQRGVWWAVLLCSALLPRSSFAADATEAPAPAASAPVEHRADTESGAKEAESTQRRRALRNIGWISLAIGAEAAVVASVTSVMLLSEKSVRDDQCNAQKVCSPHGLDANGTIATLVSWNTAAWIATAVGVGAGVALLLTNRPVSRLQPTVAVAPNAASVGLGGAF
jgi:hypothetical protein